MKCESRIELEPDELATIVADSLGREYGVQIEGLALYLEGELVGYDRAVLVGRCDHETAGDRLSRRLAELQRQRDNLEAKLDVEPFREPDDDDGAGGG